MIVFTCPRRPGCVLFALHFRLPDPPQDTSHSALLEGPPEGVVPSNASTHRWRHVDKVDQAHRLARSATPIKLFRAPSGLLIRHGACSRSYLSATPCRVYPGDVGWPGANRTQSPEQSGCSGDDDANLSHLDSSTMVTHLNCCPLAEVARTHSHA